MNERIDDKYWMDLSSEQVAYFFNSLASRARRLSDVALQAMTELAKYLFAMNTGAGAGLFLLLKASPGNKWYLVSFFLFCFGAFSVGAAYLAIASWFRELAEGSAEDINAWGRNEITVRVADENNRKRFASWKKCFARTGLIVSFVFLIVGGIIAAIPLCHKPVLECVPEVILKPAI